MSLFSIVESFCGRMNLPVPATVMGNTDTQILQIRRLLEEEGNDLALRGEWSVLTYEATHTTLAAEDQGVLSAIASHGFRHIKNGTFWDRTNKLPIMGPLSDQDWQTRKALTTTGARFAYRIRGRNLLVTPTPAAGYSWAFEYMTKYWIMDAGGTIFSLYFSLDNDFPLLDQDLLLMGLRWRWKKEKGLDYAEDFETYEAQVKALLSRDGGKKTLHMDDTVREARPGIFVPDQSWAL